MAATAPQQESSYAKLEHAEMGKVVVRFPPEASGYLHIGHAKAALLNQHYANEYKGELIFRFDDTNPEKEKEDFEQVIVEDVELLQVKPSRRSWTSDYFDLFIELVERLLNEGKAYVDDTPAEQMKNQREQRIESKDRNNSPEKNFKMWEEMKKGTAYGQTCCVRAKIDMGSDNGCLRDPTLFRCKNQPHPRTKDKYKVYPTYDFACPIVDSHEGVTHALRTTEYTDRDPQYYWIIDALKLRKPHIWAYSRLNMTHTVLSKRKLTWFVENGHVTGWDDPRMPTVRGVVRRGITIEALRQFIILQGSSRAVVVMDWDKIWAINRKTIDPSSIRYMAVESKNCVKVNVENVQMNELEVDCHPKNPELGKRKKAVSSKLLIDQTDAREIKEGDYITFVNLGNVLINRIVRDGNLVKEIDGRFEPNNKNFKKTMKISWVEANAVVKATFFYYENLITKRAINPDDDFKDYIYNESKLQVDFYVESQLKDMKKGDVVQIVRKGFFICDQPSSSDKSLELIFIPDGSTDLANYPDEIKEAKLRYRKLIVEAEVKKAAKEVSNIDLGGDKDSSWLSQQIVDQGNQIRTIKAAKADKAQIDAAVKVLLDLKANYKQLAGKDWIAPASGNATQASSSSNSGNNKQAPELFGKVLAQANLVRELKAQKADKSQVDSAVKLLLDLKADYKKQTGTDWVAPASGNPAQARSSQPKEQKQKEQKQKESKQKELKRDDKHAKEASEKGVKKQTRLCIEVKKEDNFSDWYTEVITKSEMLDYYDISGCYILRPWSYCIWENIQSFFDNKIKAIGVSNVSFPMFVSASALEREKEHIADFAPEVAWVTKSGSSDLAEPIAIRPTSETVMYPSYSKWIKSHRDLPLLLNQWCNIVRWEFKDPTPFLRTREFLWQEGHTAHATEQDALDFVHMILDYYAEVYEHMLAIPVIKGRKTEKEKFPGGDRTTTIEGFISSNGRGIQAATSHSLGQNFSKMFDITFEDRDGQRKFAYQTSWGLTTRSIGVMVMEHSDDKGLVLPPRVAPLQVVIIPCGITASSTEQDKTLLLDSAKSLQQALAAAGIIVKLDSDDHYSPGWKYNHWELKGVPVRIELGPKDIAKHEFVAVRRDTGEKKSYSINAVAVSMKQLLDEVQNNLFLTAKAKRDSHLKTVHTMDEFLSHLNDKCVILAPFCGQMDCEESIKKQTAKNEGQSGALMGAKSLCIPFEQPGKIESSHKCINPECNAGPQFYTLFGRSY